MPSRMAISNAIGHAKFFSRSHDAVIRVYDEAGNVIAPLAIDRTTRSFNGAALT
jgi:hypothetical protein